MLAYFAVIGCVNAWQLVGLPTHASILGGAIMHTEFE